MARRWGHTPQLWRLRRASESFTLLLALLTTIIIPQRSGKRHIWASSQHKHFNTFLLGPLKDRSWSFLCRHEDQASQPKSTVEKQRDSSNIYTSGIHRRCVRCVLLTDTVDLVLRSQCRCVLQILNIIKYPWTMIFYTKLSYI